MGIDRNSLSILILLSLPFQFNLILDSYDFLVTEIQKEWPKDRQLTYYENYFSKKVTFYVSLVAIVTFVFIFYELRKLRFVISLTFILNGVTWLLYLPVNENCIYLLLIIRSLQGIYLSIFQMTGIIYALHFAHNEIKCFCGCLFQVAMFTGLFILNLIFYAVSWKATIGILTAESIIFGLVIWLVPDVTIKPKSITGDYITNKNNRKPLLVMMLIMLIQQLSGIGTLLGKLSFMLQEVGLDLESHLQSCLFDFVGALSTLIGAFVIDYMSVRCMWSFSSFGLCIGLAIYAATLKIETEKWVGTLGVFVYFLFYGLGQGPIPWFLCGVMFAEEVRLESSAVNLFENIFLSPILDLLWKYLEEAAGVFGTIIFCAVVCVFAIFAGFLIPKEAKTEEDGINVL